MVRLPASISLGFGWRKINSKKVTRYGVIVINHFLGAIMKCSSLFLRTTAVAVLCLAAGTASAITEIDSSVLGSTGSAAFGNAVSGSFTDIFTFTMPSSATQGGVGTVSLKSNSINFTDLSVWQGLNEIAHMVGSSIGTATIDLFTFTSGLSDYSVHVAGITNPNAQSYGGTLSVSPVPEPKTYAMLLAGLGLLAFTARRRRNNFF